MSNSHLAGRPVIVAVTGGTASGKSMLTELLSRALSSCRVSRISMDHYYRDLSHLLPEQRNIQNFDHPDSFDIDLFQEHLTLLSQGKSVFVPDYDYVTHTRLEESKLTKAEDFILLDGILLLHFNRLRDFYDFSVFVDAPDSLRLQRRIIRDIRERGRTEDSVKRQWQSSTQPMFNSFCLPTKARADYVINGQYDLESQIPEMLESLRNALPLVSSG